MFQMKLWERWRDVFDAIVTNSHWVGRSLSHYGLKSHKAIWNGVPVTHARPSLKGDPIVAFAGRLVPKKGLHILLRAMVDIVLRLPRCRLLVAGDGPERPRLERYANDLGIGGQISFLGHISRPQLEKAFSSAWVQVIPSLWEEPFGLVSAEAMMRGTAVVVSNTGGLSEMVQHGQTGYHVPPGCSGSLTRTLLSLLTIQGKAEAMGKRARAFALKNLSDGRMVERFISVYQQLLAKRMNLQSRGS